MRRGGVASRITKSKQYKGQKPNNTKIRLRKIENRGGVASRITKSKQYKGQKPNITNYNWGKQKIVCKGKRQKQGEQHVKLEIARNAHMKQGQNDKIRANNILNQKSPAGRIWIKSKRLKQGEELIKLKMARKPKYGKQSIKLVLPSKNAR